MPSLSRIVTTAQSSWRPYGLLILLSLAAYLTLAARGFTLGFYGDVVAYQYYFEFRGVLGGMNWLITEHWQRHLLGGLFAAPMHVFAPYRYDLWYALTLFLHFLAGPFIFMFIDTLQRGQRRWLGFAVALVFLFDTLQTPSNIEFATGADHRVFLIMALLSLWAYVQFARSGRQKLIWYIINVVAYIIAIMTYEQSFFFFLLHPFIAIVEDRRRGEFERSIRYVWLNVRDNLLHVFILVIYVYFLMMLFRGGDYGIDLSLGHMLGQVADGIRVVFDPVALLNRLSQAWALSQWWLIALFAAVLVYFIPAWVVNAREEGQGTPWSPPLLIMLGLLMALLAILNSSPTVMPFSHHTRLLFAASLGSALALLGALAWIVDWNRRIGSAVAGIVVAALVGPGASFVFEHQAIHLSRDARSSRVYEAILEAAPEFAEGAEPYLLLLSDVDAEQELWLHPRDVHFPRVFGLRYGIQDFAADAVLFDYAGRPNPAQIRLTENGIVSPLKPREVIDYDRLIIIQYDSVSNSIKILDRLPEDVLSRGNFDIRADVEMETNWSLLLAGSRRQAE